MEPRHLRTRARGDASPPWEQIPRGLALAARRLAPFPLDDPRYVIIGLVHPRSGALVQRLICLKEAGAPHPVSVGRHPKATLSQEADASLSLRHVQILLSRDAEGRARIKLVDLSSPSPLVDADGYEAQMVTLHDAAALALGDSVLFVVTTLHLQSLDLDLTLLAPSEIDLSSMSLTIPPQLRSRITPFDRRLADAEARGGSAFHHVTAAWRGRRASWLLSEAELERGVLIGRYARCKLPGEAGMMSDHLSRVHALLLNYDGVPHLIDTGSQNGIEVRGRRSLIAPLPFARRHSCEMGRIKFLFWDEQ